MGRRGFVPLLLAVGFGVANGVVTFGPSFQEQQKEKQAEFAKQHDRIEPQPETAPQLTESAANPTRAVEEKTPKSEEPASSRWSIGSLWKSKDSGKEEDVAKLTEASKVANREGEMVQSKEPKLG